MGGCPGTENRGATVKRVLICSPSHAIYGGVETIVNDLCQELPARGWEPLLALGKGSRFNIVEKYRAAYPDLQIIEIDGTNGTRQSRIEALAALIKRRQPDVVLAARIFDVYEVVSRMKLKNRKAPRLAVAIRAYEPHYLYDAKLFRESIDLCAADGRLLSAACIDYCGFEPERVADIPGGIRPPKQLASPRHIAEILRIGYVGRLEQEQKRILDLVPFLRKLDETGIRYSLEIIGTGPAETDLKEKLREEVATGRVIFHGWQEHDSLYARIFPKLDCLVHFAQTEGVTIAPREAMVHGVVPVISQFTGLKTERQFLHGENALTFPIGDTATAAAHVKRLAEEPELMEYLSYNAIHSQPGKYSFAGSMNAWAKALDRCMELPRAIGPVPTINRSDDGRLKTLGISPRLAQRIRGLTGKRQVHNDPGSEWPTGSGLMTTEAAAEIMRFAAEYEQSNHG